MCGSGERGSIGGALVVVLVALKEDGADIEEEIGLGETGVSLFRLVRDEDRRIEGTSSDSRAFGSCSCICRPIVGLCTT